MALTKLVLRPGINREGTNYSNEGGWYDGDKIRFRSGNPEKLGGWSRLSANTYLGEARSLWNWMDLSKEDYLGVGTTLKYYIEKGGVYNDITPIYTTSYNVNMTGAINTVGVLNITAVANGIVTIGMNVISVTPGVIPVGIIVTSFIPLTGGTGGIGTYQTNYTGTAITSTAIVASSVQPFNVLGPITASNGLSTLTIVDAIYNPQIGDYITISGAVTLGGNITAAVLNQEYVVITTPTLSSFTITAKNPSTGLPVLANASDVNHGTLSTSIAYQYPTGSIVSAASVGWNSGPWAEYKTTSLTNPFTATLPSLPNQLIVTHSNHGLINGDYVYFISIGANPCGVIKEVLQKSFQVSNVVANVSYTVSLIVNGSTYTATSATASGGTVSVATSNGTAHVWGGSYSTVSTQIRLWTSDNYGQDLVVAPRGGPLFYWQAANTVTTRAKLLSTLATNAGYQGSYVPTGTNQVLASALQQFVIAFGANSYISGNPTSPFDPMLVRWSDQANPYQWVPSITNQSGEFRLTHGSYIVASKIARVENLIWTDSALYSMQHLGPPYVYKFDILMDNISIISSNAAITINNVTYWMGTDKFYMYDGTVKTLVCSIKQYTFENLNLDQKEQIFVGGNSGYNEVWWFYCSEYSLVIDKYVIYNYLDDVWYSGSMSRTAWLDSGIRPYPMAADYNSRILYHESNVDDFSGLEAVPIVSYVQSSDFDIEDGGHFGFVWRMLPDVNFNGSTVGTIDPNNPANTINGPYVTLTMVPRQNAGAPYGTADIPVVTSNNSYKAPNPSVYVVQAFTGQVYTRLRGRQMSFKIGSDSLGVAWQLGHPRYDMRPDGKR